MASHVRFVCLVDHVGFSPGDILFSDLAAQVKSKFGVSSINNINLIHLKEELKFTA